MSVHKYIMNAIKKSDKSYFFEDYAKQASAVLKYLNKNGYVIVPKDPSEDIIQIGVDSIASGKVRPADHVKQVYSAMVKGIQK